MTMPRTLSLFVFLLLYFWQALAASPDIMQAEKYTSDVHVADYYVSEKLDGVRARWDGTNLISRNGNVFNAPAWFIEDFPAVSLDGELWLGRGKYQQTVSVVSKHKPHKGWEQIKFMVFDLPKSDKPFFDRVVAMRQLGSQSKSAYLRLIEQQDIADNKQLMELLEAVIDKDGEGLMLHRKGAYYISGRTSHLLKLKKFSDAEAVVIGYKPGKGKYKGMVGSLKLRAADGREFYVGSGLSDELRKNPPALGSVVTYRYQGVTDAGLPRFAVYLRQRSVW